MRSSTCNAPSAPNWCRACPSPAVEQDGEAVLARQHDIEDDEVERRPSKIRAASSPLVSQSTAWPLRTNRSTIASPTSRLSSTRKIRMARTRQFKHGHGEQVAALPAKFGKGGVESVGTCRTPGFASRLSRQRLISLLPAPHFGRVAGRCVTYPSPVHIP